MNRKLRRQLARDAARKMVRENGAAQNMTRGETKQFVAKQIQKGLRERDQKGVDTPSEESMAEGSKFGIRRRRSGLYTVRSQGLELPK